MLSFSHRVRQRAQAIESWLCVGLDPQLDRLPTGITRDASGVTQFCREIILATHEHAVAFKINFAFFEALGLPGWQALHDVRDSIPDDIPVIADAKRGDIGNTSAAYAHSIFTVLNFDAVTVNPYLGWDALEPFRLYPGRALFVLCHTSNPGAGTLQDLSIDGVPLYECVARQALALKPGSAEVGLVAGATHLGPLASIRALDANVLLLVPGVGAQGAEAAATGRVAANAAGENALIAVSRDILYASTDSDFARAAEQAAEHFHAALRE